MKKPTSPWKKATPSTCPPDSEIWLLSIEKAPAKAGPFLWRPRRQRLTLGGREAPPWGGRALPGLRARLVFVVGNTALQILGENDYVRTFEYTDDLRAECKLTDNSFIGLKEQADHRFRTVTFSFANTRCCGRLAEHQMIFEYDRFDISPGPTWIPLALTSQETLSCPHFLAKAMVKRQRA